MSDLAKRLREFTVTGHPPTALENEAAARIEALERENARLRGVLYDIANIDPPDEWNNSSGIKALRLVAKEALA